MGSCGKWEMGKVSRYGLINGGQALIGPANKEDVNLQVCDLLDLTAMRCDEVKLLGLLGEALSNQIMEIVPSRFRRPYRLVWSCKNYTVISGYHLMHQRKLKANNDELGQRPSCLRQWNG